MSCTLSESCKVIIESKDKEIERLEEKKEELEERVEELENRENYLRIFLVVQTALLMIAFQVWDI